MMAQYMWVDINVNFNMLKVTKAKLIFFITYTYLSPFLAILLIYFIILGLYYFKLKLKLID